MPRRKPPPPPTIAEVRDHLAGYRGFWASLTPDERRVLQEMPEWYGKVPSEPQEASTAPSTPVGPPGALNGPPEGSEPHPPDCWHTKRQTQPGDYSHTVTARPQLCRRRL